MRAQPHSIESHLSAWVPPRPPLPAPLPACGFLRARCVQKCCHQPVAAQWPTDKQTTSPTDISLQRSRPTCGSCGAFQFPPKCKLLEERTGVTLVCGSVGYFERLTEDGILSFPHFS